MKEIEHIAAHTVSVFAKSIGERDSLRNQINACGMNAICFDKENTCIDNLGSILPKIVIVQTESAGCAWRFLFSLRLYGLKSPLILFSDRLRAEQFDTNGRSLHICSTSAIYQENMRLNKICDIAAAGVQNTKDSNGLFVGETEKIRQIRTMMPNIAQSRDPIVIVGENGTGKEFLARLIVQSCGADNVLIKIDCCALEADTSVYAELKKALKFDHQGRAITLLIDNIHRISLKFQNDLLLLVEELQRHEFTGNYDHAHGVRLIVTAKRSLEELVSGGEFRKNLYYRLNVIPIYIPPLRDRKQDISLLADYLLIKACIENNKSIVIHSHKAREAMYRYDWPGNIDELKRYMQRVAIDGNESGIFHNNRIQRVAKNSSEYILKAAVVDELPRVWEIKDLLPFVKDLSLKSICDEFVSTTEKKLVQKALESTNWNRKKAAHLLNISYKSMLNKIKAYELS